MPSRGQEGGEVGPRNPHDTVDPVHGEKPVVYPSPNRSRRNDESLSDLLDGVELVHPSARDALGFW